MKVSWAKKLDEAPNSRSIWYNYMENYKLSKCILTYGLAA